MLEHFDIVLSFAVVMLLLSLLVTAVVQIAVVILRQRYLVLKWGIGRLLRQAAPELQKAEVSKIAKAVLCHPAVSNGKTCTPAIRKEELIRLLNDLAANRSGGSSQEASAALAKVIKVGTSKEFGLAADRLKNDFQKTFPAEAARIGETIDQAFAASRQFVTDVEAWFDTVMDRTTDQFLLHTRVITVVLAVAGAFIFHIDSLKILGQLESNPEVRAQLVQSANATLQRAEDVLALSAGRTAMASAAMQTARDDLADKPCTRVLGSIPPDLITKRDGIAWITSTVHDPCDCNEILVAYEKRFDEKTQVWLQDLYRSTSSIKTDLDQSTLAILPKSLPSLGDFSAYREERMHLWGTLMTAVFLSLGAPFWYNLLKQLSSLRPAIAQKVEPKPSNEG